MEQLITIPLNEYHALKTAADNNAELKATMNLTFLSKTGDRYFLSIITGEEQDVNIIGIPKLKFLELKKAGILEITKKVFEDANL